MGIVPHSLKYGMTSAIVVDLFLGFLSRHYTKNTNSPKQFTGEREDPLRSPLLPSDKRYRRQMPHSFVSIHASCLTETEKCARAMEFLRDLGPPPTGTQASETWEIALRRSLENYIDGVLAFRSGGGRRSSPGGRKASPGS